MTQIIGEDHLKLIQLVWSRQDESLGQRFAPGRNIHGFAQSSVVLVNSQSWQSIVPPPPARPPQQASNTCRLEPSWNNSSGKPRRSSFIWEEYQSILESAMCSLYKCRIFLKVYQYFRLWLVESRWDQTHRFQRLLVLFVSCIASFQRSLSTSLRYRIEILYLLAVILELFVHR